MSGPASHMQKWPGAKVVLRPLDWLKPYAGNARTHSPAQVGQIAASITEWGFTTPILAEPNGTIIAGHGRVLAAQSLGLAEVPVMIASGWTPAQVRAYVLADNKLAENAGWDKELLRLEIGAIKDAGFDLVLAGFGDKELKKLLTIEPPADASPQLDKLSFAIVVRCTDENEQVRVLTELEAQGLKCEALIS